MELDSHETFLSSKKIESYHVMVDIGSKLFEVIELSKNRHQDAT